MRVSKWESLAENQKCIANTFSFLVLQFKERELVGYFVGRDASVFGDVADTHQESFLTQTTNTYTCSSTSTSWSLVSSFYHSIDCSRSTKACDKYS